MERLNIKGDYQLKLDDDLKDRFNSQAIKQFFDESSNKTYETISELKSAVLSRLDSDFSEEVH